MDVVNIDTSDGIATVTLDRQPVNAMTIGFNNGLARLFQPPDAVEAARVVLKRCPPVFTDVGRDLPEQTDDSKG